MVLIASGARLIGLPALFVDGRPRLISGDSWYHLRRMAFVADGAGLPSVDLWTHHPKGMVPHWPPLFDVSGGWLARAAGGGASHLDVVALAGIALVALVAAATFVLVWWMAARRTTALGGTLAVLALALSPAHHNYTRAGKVDHHALEPLATFLALDAMLYACTAAGWTAWLWASAAAVAMVILVGSIPSSSLDVALLGAAAWLRVLLAKSDQATRRRAGLVLAASFTMAGFAALPIAWTSPMTKAGLVVSFNLSLLQPVMLLAFGLGLGIAAMVPGSRWLAGATGAATAATVLLAWPAGRRALLGGSEFIAAAGFVGLIQESRGVGELGWGFALAFLSPLVLLVPAFLWWAVKRDDPDLRVLVAVLAMTTLLALTQFRFGILMSVPLAVVTGIAGASLTAAARARGRRGVAIAVPAALLLLLAPALGVVLSRSARVEHNLPVWRALEWLGHHSPSPGDPWKSGSRPAWAVMAPWDLGHELVVVGGRANVASPFIAPGETEGLTDASRFYLATSRDEAEQILERNDVRWVVTRPTAPITLARYARALGEAPERLAPSATAAVALHDRNGSATREFPLAWDTLRLAYGDEGGEVKLFERVPGARIEGIGAPPGGEVLLRTDLDVAGLRLRWFAVTQADDRGRFVIRTPYASDQAQASNVRVLDIMLRTAGRVVEIDVPESAVANGQAVRVNVAA